MNKLDKGSFDRIEGSSGVRGGGEQAIGRLLDDSSLRFLRRYRYDEMGHDERVAESWGDFYCILNEILNDDQ